MVPQIQQQRRGAQGIFLPRKSGEIWGNLHEMVIQPGISIENEGMREFIHRNFTSMDIPGIIYSMIMKKNIGKYS